MAHGCWRREQTCVNEGNNVYIPGILYSYEVNSEFYSGQYYFPEKRRSTEDALEVAAPWLKKRIFVRYHPNDPQKSVFLPNDPPPT